MAVIANTDSSVWKMIEKDMPKRHLQSEQPKENSSKVCEADSPGEFVFADTADSHVTDHSACK